MKRVFTGLRGKRDANIKEKRDKSTKLCDMDESELHPVLRAEQLRRELGEHENEQSDFITANDLPKENSAMDAVEGGLKTIVDSFFGFFDALFGQSKKEDKDSVTI